MKNIKFLNLRHFRVMSKSSSSVLTSNINILNAIVAFVFSFQFQIETVFGHETSLSLSACLCYNQTANNKPFEYKHGNQFNKIKFVWRVVLDGLNRRLLRIKRWRWLAGWCVCVLLFLSFDSLYYRLAYDTYRAHIFCNIISLIWLLLIDFCGTQPATKHMILNYKTKQSVKKERNKVASWEWRESIEVASIHNKSEYVCMS